MGNSTSASACTSISSAGSKAHSTPMPMLGALPSPPSFLPDVNCSSRAASGRVLMRGVMKAPYSGPPSTMAGITARKPYSMVGPTVVCSVAMAVSGPGCGGTMPCMAASAAITGTPT